jgi:hypothetical protein
VDRTVLGDVPAPAEAVQHVARDCALLGGARRVCLVSLGERLERAAELEAAVTAGAPVVHGGVLAGLPPRSGVHSASLRGRLLGPAPAPQSSAMPGPVAYKRFLWLSCGSYGSAPAQAPGPFVPPGPCGAGILRRRSCVACFLSKISSTLPWRVETPPSAP